MTRREQDEQGDENEGIFSAANRDGAQALVRRVSELHANANTAIATLSKESFNKLALAVATGTDVKTDATKLLYMLATYGEGDRMGKFAFSSVELAGKAASEFETSDNVIASNGNVTRSERRVTRPAVAPSPEGEKLDLSGARLQDAAAFLASKGLAKLTTDGEFGTDTKFHEIALTEAGRNAAQVSVKRAAEDGTGMPSLFEDDLGGRSAKSQTDLDAFQAMLSRARVSFRVDHSEADGVSYVELDGGMTFTFDGDGGALVGAGGVTKGTAAQGSVHEETTQEGPPPTPGDD